MLLRKAAWCLPVACTVLCLVVGPNVNALGTQDFKVYPTTYDPNDARTKAWFIEKLGRGRSRSSSISVTSTANHDITLSIYAVDATTTSDGVFALLGQADPKGGIGAWVNLDKNSAALHPAQTVIVPFTLHIPANAPVGDHDGGIVVQETTTTPGTLRNGTNIQVISRVGIRIYETVPGATSPGLQIRNFSVDAGSRKTDTFHIVIANTGNTDISPSGSIRIHEFGGHTDKSISLTNPGNIMPGKNVTYEATTPHSGMWPVWDRAQLSFDYSDKRHAAKTISYITYRRYDALIPLALIGCAAAIWQLRKHFVIQRRA